MYIAHCIALVYFKNNNKTDVLYIYMLMRDAEGRKKEASKIIYKQQGKATQHTQGSHFSKVKLCMSSKRLM